MDHGGGSSDSAEGRREPSGVEVRLGGVESDLKYLKNWVDRLEGGVIEIREAVKDLSIDFARFDERSKHFPTKGFIFGVAAMLLGAAGTLMAIVVRFVPAAS